MDNYSFSIFPNDSFLDLRPYQYGWEQCAPLHSFGPFVRNHYLFHYVISGRGVLHSNDAAGGDRLRDRLLYIAEHPEASPLHLVGQLCLFLDELMTTSSTRRKNWGGQVKDFYIQEAVTYIQQNFQRQLSVEEIAGVCKLNRSYFSKLFKETMSCTPQEFIIRLRLTRAAEMMRTTSAPIGEIAAGCGYPNQLHFSQAFKKRYGLPPREWRRENGISPADLARRERGGT